MQHCAIILHNLKYFCSLIMARGTRLNRLYFCNNAMVAIANSMCRERSTTYRIRTSYLQILGQACYRCTKDCYFSLRVCQRLTKSNFCNNFVIKFWTELNFCKILITHISVAGCFLDQQRWNSRTSLSLYHNCAKVIHILSLLLASK